MTGVATPPGPAAASRARVLLDAASAPAASRPRGTTLHGRRWTPAGPTRDGSTPRAARPAPCSTTPARWSPTALGVRPARGQLPARAVRPRSTAAVDGLRYARPPRAACATVAGAVEHSAVLVPGRAVAAAPGSPSSCSTRCRSTRRAGAVGRVGGAVAVPARSSRRSRARTARSAPGSRSRRRARPCRAHGVPLLVDAHGLPGARPRCRDGLRRARRRRPVVGRAGRRRACSSCRERHPVAPSRAAVSEAEHGRDRRRAGGAAGARRGRGVAADGRATAPTRRRRARALVDQVRTAAARVPRRRGRRRPGRPAAPRRDVLVLYVDGEVLVDELDRRGFAVASGSACTLEHAASPATCSRRWGC